MRLRYVHFPRCGPLVDVGIVFGQENMLFGWTPDDPTRRKGAINFVVGVNGTGKSSLLRAIYQSFRALKAKDLPPLPVTLAWDRFEGEKRVTCLLHHPDNSEEKPWFAVLNPIEESTFQHPVQWQGLVHRQGEFLNEHRATIGPLHFVGNNQPIITPLLEAHLPQRLVAYTSGDQLLWTQAEHPKLPSAKADELQNGGDIADDRPLGWSIEREWNEDVPCVIDQLLDRYDPDIPARSETTLGDLAKFTQELAPLKEIGGKLALNRHKWAESNPNAVFRVHPRSLRVAGISVALWQAAKELRGKTAQWQRETLRQELRETRARTLAGDDARRILAELDWFWPTHLSFTYHSKQALSPLQQQQMWCLLALADEVTVQPRGRLLAVISLGHRVLDLGFGICCGKLTLLILKAEDPAQFGTEDPDVYQFTGEAANVATHMCDMARPNGIVIHSTEALGPHLRMLVQVGGDFVRANVRISTATVIRFWCPRTSMTCSCVTRQDSATYSAPDTPPRTVSF